MANAEFSIESLIAESTGLVERKPVQQTVILSEEAYDGDEDSLTKEFYKSVEDFDSYCTLERINKMHNDEKIRMLNRLRKVYGSSIEHYGAKLSIESYIDREIRSTEDDTNNPSPSKPNNNNGNEGKKENIIVRFFKWINEKVIQPAWQWLKKKLAAFWEWVSKRIDRFRERKGDNITAEVEEIEKEMDNVISEIQNDNSSDNSNNDNSSDNSTATNETETTKAKDKKPSKLKNAFTDAGKKIKEGAGKFKSGADKFISGEWGEEQQKKIAAKFHKISERTSKILEKIKKAKETNEENAKSNEVAEAEKKLVESKKEVESIISNIAAFMKKPNAFTTKLNSLKQRFSEAREKSKAIKANKLDMKKILKELGTDKIVDIRGSKGQSGKLFTYLEETAKFATDMQKKFTAFFRKGTAVDMNFKKPENDKSDFENFDKFVTNILGWKLISMRDVKKDEITIREVYKPGSIGPLSKFYNMTTAKLEACAKTLNDLTSNISKTAEQQIKNGQPVNMDALTKLKEIVQVHTTIFTKSQMNLGKIHSQAKKIITSLYDVGGSDKSSKGESAAA